jgi:hypothetical protein
MAPTPERPTLGKAARGPASSLHHERDNIATLAQHVGDSSARAKHGRTPLETSVAPTVQAARLASVRATRSVNKRDGARVPPEPHPTVDSATTASGRGGSKNKAEAGVPLCLSMELFPCVYFYTLPGTISALQRL